MPPTSLARARPPPPAALAPDAPDRLPTAPDLLPAAPLPASRHPALLYLGNLAPGSRRTMAGALRRCADLLAPRVPFEHFPWAQLRRHHLAALRAHLLETSAPATANKVLAAVKGCVREACELGLMPHDEGARALALAGVRGERLPAGRALSAAELRAMFAACGGRRTLGAARDAALLALLYGAGLRRAELVGLDLDDFSQKEGTVRVRGKGSKVRLVPLPAGTRKALASWLRHRGDKPGPLLLPVRANGELLAHRRLSPQAVYNLLLRIAQRAELLHFRPHDLRRTFIGDLLEAGADLVVVQRLVGHASPLTTARYDRRPEQAKRRAVERLTVPVG